MAIVMLASLGAAVNARQAVIMVGWVTGMQSVTCRGGWYDRQQTGHGESGQVI